MTYSTEGKGKKTKQWTTARADKKFRDVIISWRISLGSIRGIGEEIVRKL